MKTRYLPTACIGALLGAFGCVQSNFLEGVSCKNDDECGRGLECSAGFCGGCPDDALLDDGRCGCPGDRILECQRIDPVDPCLAICNTEAELCQVAVLRDDVYEVLAQCEEASDGEQCFRVLVDPSACSSADDARVVLEPPDPVPTALIVNCPPPAMPEGTFECAES